MGVRIGQEQCSGQMVNVGITELVVVSLVFSLEVNSEGMASVG